MHPIAPSLSKENIRKIYQDYLDKVESGLKAEDRLSEFFDDTDYEDLNLNKGVTQRIILLAAKYRKEVTSTVLWLLNFKVRIQCFRAVPYSMGDQLFLNVDQIIPTQDAEEYMIGMAEKAQDDINSQTGHKQRHIIRKEFWSGLLQRMNNTSNLFQNISPGIYHFIGTGSGIRGIWFNFVVSKKYARAEVYIDRGDREINKYIFNQLFQKKTEIEKAFGRQLAWERLEQKRACRIKAETTGNVFEKEQWGDMISFMIDSMKRLENTLKLPLSQIKLELESESDEDTG